MAAVPLHEVVGFLDRMLQVERFRDYCPNGLQVESGGQVTRVATGVSASLAFIEAARDMGAQLAVVHHGLIWGPGIGRIVGPAARRLQALLGNGISLAAYHLPLDAHAELGNNAGLGEALGFPGGTGAFGDVKGHALGVWADLAPAWSRQKVIDSLRACTGTAHHSFVFPFGPERVTRVGWCTGAASDLLEDAATAGCQVFVTGELAERAGEIARELGITLLAAGHTNTEVYGPRRLVGALGDAFPTLQVQYLDVPSSL